MVGGGARALVRRYPVLLAAVAALVVTTLVVALLTRPWSPDKVEQEVAAPAPGDRVLQSVHLAMQDDGSLSDISDTVVIARAGGGNTDTVSTTYDPSAVVDELPVRVLTSYQTDQRAGTDLGELKGYTGRVRIDLRVENLTVRPQQVRYDVAGRSRTSTAMVGAPLTVVASAALPGTDPSKVVTTAPDGKAGAGQANAAGATNGVLSQSPDATTQVQWATILAPPQLDATATLRLVVDAQDFAPPTIDLSVQPGLVTDPSLGALVDAAFSPQSSTELELQSRTIKLVGNVNQVLVRASDTISEVRGTLDSTSETLGTKTVGALRSSTQDVTSSMKTSSDNLEALGKDLGSSLESTSSATLATMAQTVSQLDQVLGDTSVQPSAPKATGRGCEQKVQGPGQSASVYASLQQVSAQLDGYAAATAACKVLLQKAILSSIGPAEPTDENCRTSSVTCSLAGVQTSFAAIADRFVRDGQLALAGLGPAGLQPVTTSLEDLVSQLGALTRATDELLAPEQVGPKPSPTPTPSPKPTPSPTPTPTPAPPTFEDLTRQLDAVGATLTALTKALDQLKEKADAGATEATAMQEQNTALADQLCLLVGEQPGKLSWAEIERLRSYLTAQSCPDPAGVTTKLTPPDPYKAAMETRLSDQAATFTLIAADTDTTPGSKGVGATLAQLRKQIEEIGAQLGLLDAALTAEDQQRQKDADQRHKNDEQRQKNDEQRQKDDEQRQKNHAQRQKVLEAEVGKLRKGLQAATNTTTGLVDTVGGVDSAYADAKGKFNEALARFGEKAKSDVRKNVNSEIRQITDRGQADSEQLGKMFERSAAGLSATAEEIQADGADAVRRQQKALGQSRADAGQTLSAGTQRALTQVSADVSGSTRDLDATRTMLTQNLANVLLDLGDRKVRGSGVLGALATSAAAAGSADYQLGLAADRGSAYASVRERDVGAIMLRQAQAEAALQRQAEMAPFARTLPPTVEHRTVYVFRLDGGR